jgi:hypothetical protein
VQRTDRDRRDGDDERDDCRSHRGATAQPEDPGHVSSYVVKRGHTDGENYPEAKKKTVVID